MKNLTEVQTENDLFKMYQTVVKDIFTEKKVNVDFTDDDSMADYCMTLHECGFPKYEFREITQLLMYNSMLQAKAFSFTPVNFILKRTEYKK
jgi:hypothetical protein